ncbi:MAG: hypothetical protein ACFHVJ_11625 [Aestuariibacter sp.]
MRKTLLLSLLLSMFFGAANAVESHQGKIKILRQTQGDIYFSLDTMPAGIAWFFMNPTTTGTFGNCDRSAPGEEAVSRMFSLLLSSKVSQSTVKVSYCQQGSYGLITTPGGYVESKD